MYTVEVEPVLLKLSLLAVVAHQAQRVSRPRRWFLTLESRLRLPAAGCNVVNPEISARIRAVVAAEEKEPTARGRARICSVRAWPRHSRKRSIYSRGNSIGTVAEIDETGRLIEVNHRHAERGQSSPKSNNAYALSWQVDRRHVNSGFCGF